MTNIFLRLLSYFSIHNLFFLLFTGIKYLFLIYHLLLGFFLYHLFSLLKFILIFIVYIRFRLILGNHSLVHKLLIFFDIYLWYLLATLRSYSNHRNSSPFIFQQFLNESLGYINGLYVLIFHFYRLDLQLIVISQRFRQISLAFFLTKIMTTFMFANLLATLTFLHVDSFISLSIFIFPLGLFNLKNIFLFFQQQIYLQINRLFLLVQNSIQIYWIIVKRFLIHTHSLLLIKLQIASDFFLSLQTVQAILFVVELLLLLICFEQFLFLVYFLLYLAPLDEIFVFYFVLNFMNYWKRQICK